MKNRLLRFLGILLIISLLLPALAACGARRYAEFAPSDGSYFNYGRESFGLNTSSPQMQTAQGGDWPGGSSAPEMAIPFSDSAEMLLSSVGSAAPGSSFAADAPASVPIPSVAASGAVSVPEAPRMIVRNANMHMEASSDEFGFAVDSLRQVNNIFGGYIEGSHLRNIENRQIGRSWGIFTITLRVPVAEFDRVIEHIERMANVTHLSETTQDVTDRFYDMESRLRARLVEEERVLAFIEEAANIQELLALERRLADVRTQIQSYRSQMAHLADRAAYSSVFVELREILEFEDEEPTTLAGRLASAFGDSASGTLTFFQEILIFFAAAVIPLVFLGLIALVVVRIVIKRRKK
jgi:hypothetical protein